MKHIVSIRIIQKGERSYHKHENMIMGSYAEAIGRREELNNRLED